MYYIVATIAIIAFELLYFSVARRFHIVDRPNERSSHHRVALLGAGIVFYFAVLFYSLTHGLAFHNFLIAITVLAVVSFVDDLHPLPSWLRLFTQIATVLLTFWTDISAIAPWQLVVLIVFFTGVLNIYNFMDGINGMLAAYSFVVVGTFGYLDLFVHPFVDFEFIASVLVAIVVFGFFNFRTNARCFAGDVGSISMGLIVLFLLVRYVNSFPGSGLNVSRICFVIVFLADGFLTVAKRFLSGRNIFAAHREHAYETMVNDLHVPYLAVSTGYALLQLAINIGYILVEDKNFYTIAVALILILAYGLFFFFGNRSGKIHPIQ